VGLTKWLILGDAIVYGPRDRIPAFRTSTAPTPARARCRKAPAFISGAITEGDSAPVDTHKKKTDIISLPPRIPPAVLPAVNTRQVRPDKTAVPSAGSATTTAATPVVPSSDPLEQTLAGVAAAAALAAAAMQIWIFL
jgi:hypothetical protein